VDYVIDYGISECVNASGEPTGAFRSETRGLVRYAPGVGPVESDEVFIPLAEPFTGQCEMPPVGVGEAVSRAQLQLDSMPVVPVRTRTWGAVKAVYR
jgi:hypothetical protein